MIEEYPAARIEYIKQDLGADIIADDSFVEHAKKMPAKKIMPLSKAKDIAWVVYTSGSTGNPKGVIYTNEGICAECAKCEAVNELSSETIALSSATMSFCATILDIYSPLCCGGTCHIASEECRMDKYLLEKYLLLHRISHAYISPRMLSKINLESPSLKVVFTAGEKVTSISPRKFKINVLYGMTETIGLATCFELDSIYDNTPIGMPVPGTEVYLLDEMGNLADEGEICVAGEIASEYWNRPELTAQAFTKNPFSNDPDLNILLHTGDIGKRLPDGNLLFLNRKDWMIKINGQRVEPGEVEYQIKSIEGVSEAVVKGFTNVHGQAFLCAWYTGEDNITEAHIRSRLAENLASYMMPSFIIKIEAFALNTNGKLDRNVLAAPDVSTFRAAFEAPMGEIEEAICKAFQEILGVESIGRNDDFFSLGGDSIQAVSLCAKLESHSIKSADIFKGRTPKGIAEQLSSKYEAKKRSYKESDESYPLSAGQMGVYYACIHQKENLMYNLPFACQLPFDTDCERLSTAIEKVLHSYSAFGVCFRVLDGEVRMQRRPAYVDIKIKNACEDDLSDIKKSFVSPFDIEKGELSRFLIVKTERAIHLIADIHHIIFDGSSVGVFFDAIAKAYDGEEIPQEKITIFEAACIEQDAVDSNEYKDAEAYFEGKLTQNDFESTLQFDFSENSESLLQTAKIIESDFDEIVDSTQIKSFVRKNGITEATLFMGAFAWALSKLSGDDGFCFCTVDNGRHAPILDDTIGMLVRTLPLSVVVDETLSAKDYLRPLSALFYETIAQDIYPFYKLSEKLGIANDVMYVYQSDMINSFNFGGRETNLEAIDTGYALSKISMQVLKHSGSYKLVLTYRGDLYIEEKMHVLISMMKSAIVGFINDQKLKDIPLVNNSSIKLLDSFHGEKIEYDNCTVIDMFRDAVKRYPDNIAVVSEDSRITYRELDEVTDRLAAYLVKQGIGKEDIVAILSNRNEMMVICPIAVLKAGAIYQPLDNTYPSERLTFMVKDSGAKMIISPRDLRHLVELDLETFFVEDIEKLSKCDIALSRNEIDDAFVILYTSGSTGNPKGCILEHKNLIAFIHYYSKLVKLDNMSRVSAYSSFGFDANMMDVFPTLCTGATSYIIPLDLRLDIDALNRYFEENLITHAFFTTQVGRQFITTQDNKTLRCICTGGETLTPFDPPQSPEYVNLYGPTETTVFVTSFTVDKLYQSVPIGRANDNTDVYVVDKFFRRLPIFVPGELCIAGVQVGREYLNLPEKTAEVFVENPFNEDPKYKTIYRTGDIVKFLPDGNIQFVGRKDSQVKIRGFRIELTEVEEVIHRFDGIKDATVCAYDDPSGGKFIAAFVVSEKEIDIDKLNDFISAEKPAYMVPAVTMQIDEIPLNQNHKVNKKALPKPERKAENILKPQNDIQQKIFELVAEILGYQEFGINTDLFYAGLSSISSIKFMSLFSSAFDRSLSMAELKENNTIEKLEQLLATQNAEDAFEIRDEYPLTKAQEGIFYECMNKPNSTFYNVPYLIKLGQGLDIEKLKLSIATTINAHPYLMTTMFLSNEGVRCRRDPSAVFSVSDIEEMSIEDVSNLGKTICKPFVIEGGRLVRVAIIYSNDTTLLFFDAHHSIFDGSSLSILMEDISRVYSGEVIEAEKYNGYEAALLEESMRKSDRLDKAKSYFAELLSNFDGTSLPNGDYPDKKGYLSYKHSLKNISAQDILNFTNKTKLTRNAFFTAAFGFLLAKYQGEQRSAFSTVYNGRSDFRFAQSISMFVKTLPVICNTENRQTVDYIKGIQDQLDASRLNDIYSFAEMHTDMDINADVMLVYQDYGFEHETFCGEKYETYDVCIDAEKMPLSIAIVLKDGKIEITAEYEASRYSQTYIKYFIESFEQVLAEMTEKTSLGDISLVDEKMLEILESFHGEEYDYEPCSVVDLLREAMRRYPDNIAVVSGETKLTYRELDEVTNRLAAYLIKQGIGKEDVVAILSDRNEMIAICPIAVVKAGAMYQPLDSTYPRDRLTYMVKDSGAKMLISQKDLRSLVEIDVKTLFTKDIESLAECDIELPSPTISDAFVILYTSGSTGNPKGCILEHKNFAQYLRFYNRRFGIDNQSNVGAYATFGFDQSVAEVFSTIIAGATMHIIPIDMRLELDRLNRYFEDNNISQGFMTTQVGRQYIASIENHSLKHLIVAGEALTPIAPPENYIVVNGYGPTETTCGVSLFDIDRLYQSVPLGKPNTGVKAYILDKDFRRVPVSVPGELCIAGMQVSRGYLNLPEKTREVFVENPFTSDPEYNRLYRTGDIVCFLPDGNLQFIGRKDSQVKIRGFRIELTEIEEIIRRFEGIKDATVCAFDEPNGGKAIAAYIVSDSEVDIEALKGFIRNEKPAYMVPAVIMQIEKIPLTQNQKVNKKALPKPKMSQSRNYVAPQNDVEKDFCDIMGETLNIEKYSAIDSFFEVGGSSISATKVLVSALAKGYAIAYSDLFKCASPRAIAEHIIATCSVSNRSKTDKDISEYDYSNIDALIQNTSIHAIDEAIAKDPSIVNGKLGNVLLTGATGFLGMHILYDYLTHYDGKITCIIRKTLRASAEKRLKSLLFFYFSNDFAKEFEEGRIVCIEAGLNDDDLPEKLIEAEFDTVIHSAACVKHFVSDDILYRINTQGTENILKICEERGKRFIHISTYSVAGNYQDGMSENVFRENNLYIGQLVDNEYIRTKFLAERCVLEAAQRGVEVKIMRLGNLMGRISDGEFQINFSTNGFMRDVRGVTALGYSSKEREESEVDFSPIDSTADAILKLADSELPMHIYHVYNVNCASVSDLVEIFEECGFPMQIVSEAEYKKQIALAAQKYKDNAYMSDIIGGLIAYKNADGGDAMKAVDADNTFTADILSRLGFTWPDIDKAYVRKMIENLIGMGFFERHE